MAASEDDLRAALEQRFKGARSGACIAAAVIENGTTVRAYFCANAKSERSIDERHSIRNRLHHQDDDRCIARRDHRAGRNRHRRPLGETAAPRDECAVVQRGLHHGGQYRHTPLRAAVLPWRTTDFDNPYARLTEADLLGTLAKTQLKRAPGSQREYSNFALMVLSYALAKRSGRDFETLLRERLLSPLGMDDTFIVTRPSAVRVAEGHFSNSRSTGPWDVRVDLAGAGGVRATLPDMVRYLEGQLGMRDSSITPVLAQTQEQITGVGSQATSMVWEILSTENGRTFVMHPGGTGGFSSFFAFDRAAKRGVVLLSDTALTDVGGLRRLAIHLLDPSLPAGTPRNMATADGQFIDALVGRYRLPIGLGMELRRQGPRLTIQADGERGFERETATAGAVCPLHTD